MNDWKERVAPLLAKAAGSEVRPYSTYDFGRARDPEQISVVVEEQRGRTVIDEVARNLSEGLVVFIGTGRWLGDEKHRGKVEVVVGRGEGQMSKLRIARSDAINYGMTTEDVIAKLETIDR